MADSSPSVGAHLLRLASILLACLPLIGLAASFWPVIDMLNAGLTLMIGACLALLPIALWRRDRVAAALLLLGLSIAALRLGSAISGTMPVASDAHGPSLSIVTLSSYHANPTPDRLRSVIEATGADLLLLQESDGAAWQAIAKALPRYHRLTSCNGPRCSITILSRWPLTRVARPQPGEKDLPDILAARIARPGASFDVVAVHLPRPTFASAVHQRAALLATIRTSASRPLIVGGDFNMTPGMLALTRFERSSALRRATPFLPTYPASTILPALLPIDQLYLSRHWSPRICRTIGGTGSDHLGLICTLQMRENAPRQTG